MALDAIAPVSRVVVLAAGLDGWTSSTEGLDRFCNQYEHLSMELVINLTRPVLDHRAPGGNGPYYATYWFDDLFKSQDA